MIIYRDQLKENIKSCEIESITFKDDFINLIANFIATIINMNRGEFY